MVVEIVLQKENNVSLITLEWGGGFRNEKVLRIGAWFKLQYNVFLII